MNLTMVQMYQAKVDAANGLLEADAIARTKNESFAIISKDICRAPAGALQIS